MRHARVRFPALLALVAVSQLAGCDSNGDHSPTGPDSTTARQSGEGTDRQSSSDSPSPAPVISDAPAPGSIPTPATSASSPASSGTAELTEGPRSVDSEATTSPSDVSAMLGSSDDTAISSGESSDPPRVGVAIVEGRIFVDGTPFQVKGVNWNPVPKGGQHPQNLDYAGFVSRDAELMQAAGINAVRTYEHLSDVAVLDELYARGIFVFTTVYGWWQDDPSVVTERVNAVKSHPAIIAYVLGNEWNYNQLYANGAISTEQARDQINAAAALVKQADPSRPVTTIYGELDGLGSMVAAMPDIDLWGINSYRGISFGDLFEKYAEATNKPMFLGEFGADAFNANTNMYDPESQATATSALLGELTDAVGAGRSVGGFLFEWADEWWKDGSGTPSAQDTGGIAPGGGPYPDQTFNEEWWGLVDIERTPRSAYTAVVQTYAP